MAILKNQIILLGAYNITTNFNQLEVGFSNDPLDDTRWNDSARQYIAGMDKWAVSTSGFFLSNGSTAIDDILSGNLGTADVACTVAAVDGTEGTRAYFGPVLNMEYGKSGAVGDQFAIALKLEGSGGWAVPNGRIEHALGNTTASSSSTGSQLGALAATQKIYSVLHVVSASGTTPTLDVIIQSDDNSGFTTPTTRITHTQATGITSETKSLAGAVTDDYWRANWTIGGTGTPTFSFLVAIGILGT